MWMVIAKYIDDGSRSEAVVSIVLSMCVVNHLDVVEQNLCRTDPGAGTGATKINFHRLFEARNWSVFCGLSTVSLAVSVHTPATSS